jgi:uncharacterized OsmC-like protein
VEIHQGRGSVFEEINLTLRIPAPLDDDQRERILAVAAKCPVHRALSGESEVVVNDRLENG